MIADLRRNHENQFAKSKRRRALWREQLVLSVRTVEGHVYRACFKLDVADRDEPANVVRKKS